MTRLAAALAGFLLGAAAAVVLVGQYVRSTYVCQPGLAEPCGLGGHIGFGLVLYWAPAAGLVCAALGYWLVRLRQRRRAARGVLQTERNRR